MREIVTPDEVCDFLKSATGEDPDSYQVANLLLIAARAPEKNSLHFLKAISDGATTNIAKLRCAYCLGNLTNSPVAIDALLKLLDLEAKHFTATNNACIYSFERLGYVLSAEVCERLENQIGSSWRLQIYKNNVRAQVVNS